MARKSYLLERKIYKKIELKDYKALVMRDTLSLSLVGSYGHWTEWTVYSIYVYTVLSIKS